MTEKESADFAQTLTDLAERIRGLELATARIETKFAQAEGVLAFVKWAGGVAVALAAIYAWASQHLTFK